MKLDLYKKINILLLLVSIAVYVSVKLYWSQVCESSGCSFVLLEAFLEPLIPASIFTSGFSLFFLFLPSHYFKSWLLKIASWGFVLSLVMVASVDPQSSSVLSINRIQMVKNLGTFFGILTAIQAAYIFWRARKTNSAAV